MLQDSNTIGEAKEVLQKGRSKGVRCPCCNRLYKVYRRNLNSGMAKGLISALKLGADKKFIHLATKLLEYDTITSTTEFSKLRHWGLVVEMENDNPEKKSSGFWMLTQKGVDFAEGKITVPKYIVMLQNELLAVEGDEVTVIDCLGDDFNYRDLMGYSDVPKSSVPSGQLGIF